METLEYDPKTKIQIEDALYKFLYAPITRQSKTRIETLIARNTVMGGHTHKHFIYRGIVYNADVTTPPVRKNRLVPQLRDEMEEYLADQRQINGQELPFVLGYIKQVLNSSNNFSDYFQMLPEALHEPLESLRATCPCRASSITAEKAQAIRTKNQVPIDMIKRRLVMNLLI